MKYFIAKDTKKPLKILGGYKILEDGSIERKNIPEKFIKPQATIEDVKLLEKYGVEGLKKKEFYGVLDRLQNSLIIGGENDA